MTSIMAHILFAYQGDYGGDCPVCGRPFSTGDGLRRHIEAKHADQAELRQAQNPSGCAPRKPRPAAKRYRLNETVETLPRNGVQPIRSDPSGDH